MHPAHRAALRGPSVRVPFQEGAPLQEAVAGQFVEGVGRVVAAYPGEQVVDEGEGVGGVGALRTLLGPPRRHHLLQGSVYDAQERPQAPALLRGELGAAAVASVDPGVQRVRVAADDRDRAAVGSGQRRGHRDAEVGEALGRAVLAGDRGGVGGLGVEMVLEEVPAPGGGEAVAAVEQPLVDGFAGQRGPGGVSPQQGAQRGCGERAGETDERGTRQMLGHRRGR